MPLSFQFLLLFLFFVDVVQYFCSHFVCPIFLFTLCVHSSSVPILVHENINVNRSGGDEDDLGCTSSSKEKKIKMDDK